jgi:hypothetical protein
LESSLPLVLAGILALVHFLGEEIEEYIEGYKEELVSFGSGVSITYIFMQLLPEFHGIVSESSILIFIFPLLGFSSIHLLEKYIALSDVSGEKMRKEYSELHTSFIFFYHVVLGYLVSSLVRGDKASVLLFFIPLVLHLAVSSISVSELHEKITRNTSLKILISAAPVIGVAVQMLGYAGENLFNPGFGTVIGVFFYITVRDSIPSGEKGKPLEYLAGMLIYLVIILIAQTL